MKKPHFFRIMIKVFSVLFLLISIYILYIFIRKGMNNKFISTSIIYSYLFVYSIILNLLGYYIYKKNKIGIVLCSIIILHIIYVPSILFIIYNSWLIDFSELLFFSIECAILDTLLLIVLFLSIYIFYYRELKKLLIIFGTIFVVCILVFYVISFVIFENTSLFLF